MATYAAEVPTEQGLAATYRTPANGDLVPGGVYLIVKNGNAAVLTLTIVTPESRHGDLPVTDRTVSVPATTGERIVYIPNDSTYVDPVTGLVTLNWSVTATVTYAILRISG